MVLPLVLDIVLNFDKSLPQILSQYGTWTYVLLFLILFCETGLVITRTSRATRSSSLPVHSQVQAT